MEIVHEILYYDSRKKKKRSEIWGYYDKDDNFIYHNKLNKPSDILYHIDGGIRVQYEQHGKLHRTDGPALILYNKDNSINYEWYFLNDEVVTKEEVMESKHVKDINDLILV